MTRPVTHIWRLLRWGRILARHGALRIIEEGAATPPAVRRLCRIARAGTVQPRVPDYCAAFQAIGPAAIKLGQTLATRPDLVGEEAAHNLLALQDSLPPVGFAEIRHEIEQALGRPLDQLFAHFEEDAVGAASIAQVHRATTPDGRLVAVKVQRPGIAAKFARDIETYEWAAAHLEALGGEAARLRPREIVANFKRWTLRELDLRREAASASELAETMAGVPGYRVPAIDWDRTTGKVMTLAWIDGIKISDMAALRAAGHDLPVLARHLVIAFLTQAIHHGFFHADMHQGNLFIEADGTIAAIDFGIMGRIDRRARVWLGEIIYGLTTGNYTRVAEIHFEAQYVPSYHSLAEFATALRAVGEPMRGKAVAEQSVGNMLDGLFAITRDFDMRTQPHLLLLQKTMVMVEGLATLLDPGINMWEVSGPFVESWMRDEMGPEAFIANRLRSDAQLLTRLPDLVRRIEERFPKGGAPEAPPLPEITLMWDANPSNWEPLAGIFRRECAGGIGNMGVAGADVNIRGAGAPGWDRFAHWPRGRARALLLALVAVLLASALVPLTVGKGEIATAPKLIQSRNALTERPRDDDLKLYDSVITRLRHGENYYSFIAEEQRKAGFPLRPGFAVRMPTLAYINAAMGLDGKAQAPLAMLAAVALMLGMALAWWRRLSEEACTDRQRLFGTTLMFFGASLGLNRYYFPLHELWAGGLLALSFGLHRPRPRGDGGKWLGALAAAALALAIREHALPFVLLMAGFALWRRAWREAAAWVLLVAAFGIALAIHLHIVAGLALPSDRLGPSWLVMRGLGGWLADIVLSSNLRYLPHWLAGPLVFLMILGWAGWRSTAGAFATLLYLGYGIGFMLAGRDENFYWGAMVAPAMFVGLAFLPMAAGSLIKAALPAKAVA